MTTAINPLASMTAGRIEQTYLIRPLPQQHCEDKWRRYADGAWIPDDGERDLAFISDGYGAPMCLYVDLPYYAGIQWSWQTRDPFRWHYMVRSAAEGWGPRWARDAHPNQRASRSGMETLSSARGCANGRGAKFQSGDAFVEAGRLWTADGTLVTQPEELVCMDCLDDGAGHARDERRRVLNDLRSDIQSYEADIARLERQLSDARDMLAYKREDLEAAQ